MCFCHVSVDGCEYVCVCNGYVPRVNMGVYRSVYMGVYIYSRIRECVCVCMCTGCVLR